MLIDVRAIPNAKRFGLEMRDGRLVVRLTSRPEGNKANLELVKAFSEMLGCGVRLVKGAKSRAKTLEINMSERELMEKITECGCG